MALLQRLAAVRGRLSLCADQAAAAKWWLGMPRAPVSAEGPMPKDLSTSRPSPLMTGGRHQGRHFLLGRDRWTGLPLTVQWAGGTSWRPSRRKWSMGKGCEEHVRKREAGIRK